MAVIQDHDRDGADLQPTSRSPWALATTIKTMRLHAPANMAARQVVVPGSKSFSNRALLLAAAAETPSTLEGLLQSDDVYHTMQVLRQLGCQITLSGEKCLLCPPGKLSTADNKLLFLGSAGTLARFLPPILAAKGQGSFHLDGTAQLRKRPLLPLLDALRQLGVLLQGHGSPEGLPLTLQGGTWQGGDVCLDGSISSQFVSGLLLAAPFAAQATSISLPKEAVQHAYIAMTCQLLQQFGAKLTPIADAVGWHVTPSPIQGQRFVIEADVSTAGYFWAWGAITGYPTTVRNVTHGTLQPDHQLLSILEEMGCIVETKPTGITVHRVGKLRSVGDIDVCAFSDQLLTLAAVAAYADSPTRIYGASHVRHHESNRLLSAASMLAAVGIETRLDADSICVYPGPMRVATIETFDDHRVAMAASLLAYGASGLTIVDPGCVSKTCPTYFTLLEELGLQCDPSTEHA